MNTVTNKIDYDEIVGIVKNQLIEVMNQNIDFYKDYSTIVSKELQYIKKHYKDDPKCICVVLKFGSASVNYFQSVLPCSVTVLSEANHLDVCQKLLTEYVEYFNLVRVSNNTIQQIYETPDFSNNFENEMRGFKSLGTFSAAFVLSKSANSFSLYNVYSQIKPINGQTNPGLRVSNIYNLATKLGYNFNSKQKQTYTIVVETDGASLPGYRVKSGNTQIYPETGYLKNDSTTGVINVKFRDELGLTFSGVGRATLELDSESVPVLTNNFGSNFNLDSQIMYQKGNFSDSIGKYGTRTITFGTYFMDDINLFNDVLDVCISENNPNVEGGVNHAFALHLEFNNGRKYTGCFRLAKFDASQKIGEIPSSTYVFTN